MDTLMQKPWTDDELTIVKNLAAQGKTASEIGEAIGRTRNSVIGAVFRHKVKLLTRLEPKPKVQRVPRVRQRQGDHLRRVFLTTSTPKEGKHETSPPPPPSKENYVPFLERKYFQCKFIVEKRGETHICCGTAATRRGWCDYHASIVFRPIDPKPEKKDGGYGIHPALRKSSK